MAEEYWKTSPFGERSLFSPMTKERQRLEREQRNQKDTLNNSQKESEIKVLSNALNSEGNPLKLDSRGLLVAGQKRLHLFTAKSSDGFVGFLTTAEFLSKYQLIFNDSFPISSFTFTINNKSQPLRKFAQFVSVNKDEKLLSKAIHITSLGDINSFINEAKEKFPNGLSIKDKILYWNHKKKYDYKHTQAKGFPLVYIKDIGIFESDHIGNIAYASVMGSPYAQSFHDGDFLQKDLKKNLGVLNGIDDPYDSYSLAIGATCGDSLSMADFIRVFDFHKSVLISKYNVRTFNYKMKFINYSQDKTMIYDESFTVYGD